MQDKCLLFDVLGFLDQEDLVYCPTENKFNIFIDYKTKNKEDSANILFLLKSCLRRQRSTCVVSLGFLKFDFLDWDFTGLL